MSLDRDLRPEFVRMRDELERIEAALPDCPTCGGFEYRDMVEGVEMGLMCPADCDHGKVSVAQLAALWQAVHGSYWDDDQAAVRLPNNDLTATAKHLLAYLRSVRPGSPSPEVRP